MEWKDHRASSLRFLAGASQAQHLREAHEIDHQLYVLGQTNQPAPPGRWVSAQKSTGELLALGDSLHLSRQMSLCSLSTKITQI